jgi:hypothetical protein
LQDHKADSIPRRVTKATWWKVHKGYRAQVGGVEPKVIEEIAVLDRDQSVLDADVEAIYSYEGTREMNTLIVGRAISGFSAFI